MFEGFTLEHVAAHLDHESVPRRRRGLTDDQVRDAAHLYLNGQSLARIANRHHVAPHTIRPPSSATE